MDKPRFVYVTYIGAAPEKVWEALTEGNFSEQYWGGRKVQSDWKVGSEVTYRYEQGKRLDILGKVLRCEPPKVLSYTFRSEHNGDEPPSRVTFELKGMGWATQLTLTHDDFVENSKVYEGISRGWPGILSNLKSLLELGKPLISQWGEPPRGG